MATWEITRAVGAGAIPARDPRELSTAEAIALLDELRDLDPGLVVLGGGDPFERRDLFAIIEEALSRQLRVAIAPGVTGSSTVGAIHRLAGMGVRHIALGLQGLDAPTRAAITAARDVGLPLQIDTTLTRRSVEDLPSTAELIAGIAPVLWNVCFVVPSGAARLGPPLGPDACERVFHFLREWSERTGVAVTTTAAPAYRRVVAQREATRRRLRRPPRPRPLPLNDGKGLVFVASSGDVYPSGLLPLTTANVREASLAEIYRRSRLFRALRDESRLGGKCGICPFRSLCGGSRARAYAMTGDFLAADPSCSYVPAAPPRRLIASAAHAPQSRVALLA